MVSIKNKICLLWRRVHSVQIALSLSLRAVQPVLALRPATYNSMQTVSLQCFFYEISKGYRFFIVGQITEEYNVLKFQVDRIFSKICKYWWNVE